MINPFVKIFPHQSLHCIVISYVYKLVKWSHKNINIKLLIYAITLCYAYVRMHLKVLRNMYQMFSLFHML